MVGLKLLQGTGQGECKCQTAQWISLRNACSGAKKLMVPGVVIEDRKGGSKRIAWQERADWQRRAPHRLRFAQANQKHCECQRVRRRGLGVNKPAIESQWRTWHRHLRSSQHIGRDQLQAAELHANE